MKNQKALIFFICVVALFHDSLVFSQETPITITELDTKDEYVLIKNEGNVPENLEGWMLYDHDYGKAAVYSYVFEELILKPGEVLQMQSGKKNKKDDQQADERNHKKSDVTHYFRWSKRNVWNNSCDIAYLKDAKGNLAAEVHEGKEIRDGKRENCR